MIPDSTHPAPAALPAIFWAGLTCGVLDISAAFVTWAIRGVKPFIILQGIASGLLGARAFQGGWPAAVLGAACHFFISSSRMRRRRYFMWPAGSSHS